MRGRGHEAEGRTKSRRSGTAAAIRSPSSRASPEARRAARGCRRDSVRSGRHGSVRPAQAKRVGEGVVASALGGRDGLVARRRRTRRSRCARARRPARGRRCADAAARRGRGRGRAAAREQPAVVGDGEHAEAGPRWWPPRCGGRRPAGRRRRGPSRARRGWRCGLEHAELQRLVALLLAAGEVDVERPRSRKRSSKPMRSASAAISAATSPCRGPRPRTQRCERRRRSDTPGTSVGYCMARNRPAWARSHAGRASRSTPSRVTVPPSDLVAGPAHEHVATASTCPSRSGPSRRGPRRCGRRGRCPGGSPCRRRRPAGRSISSTCVGVIGTATSIVAVDDPDLVDRHGPGGRQRPRARRSTSENELPCFQHSIGLLVAGRPRPRTARCPGGCRCRRWRRRRRRCGRRRSRCPPTSTCRAVPGSRSSSGRRARSRGRSRRAPCVELGATIGVEAGHGAPRRGQLVEHLVEEAGDDQPLGHLRSARRGSRGRSAGPRRSGRRPRRGCSARRCSRSRGSGTDSAQASSDSLRLRLVWKALVPGASLRTLMSPV